MIASASIDSSIDVGGGHVWGNFFLAKFDPAGGHLWSKGFEVQPIAAATARGEVFVAGSFSGALTVGEGVKLQGAGATDIFLVKMTP